MDNLTVSQEIAEALVPGVQDTTKKAAYLRERIAGFNVRESLQRAGCSMRSVNRWREEDPEFNHLDTKGLIEARRELNNQYINLEFTRNMRLALQKDFDILLKSVSGEELTSQEHQYLLKARNHYTAQQLVLIKELAGEVEKDKELDFTSLTFELRREREQVTIKASSDGMS